MDYAVRFEDVYKKYPFYQHITAGFKSFIFNLPGSIASLKKTMFIALKGVSFEIKKGETFGIIGRNGSGKSTILGIIAGVIRHDKGLVETNGKISSLLELGAGFHPDLSGIENIILNGILMGNTRQDMLEKMDEIIEFSELGDFIYQPLRTYSSGMYVRLGFSVAVHIDPEILLVDEALAVGDLSFQEKCLRKIMEFKESGATITIVSHDLTVIARLCDRVTLIDSGSIKAIGKPKEVIMKYLDHLGQKTDAFLIEDQLAVETEEQTVSTELAATQDEAELLQASRYFSWWDSPSVIKECEAIITGSPEVHFYEFLRKQYVTESLEKGLSICNRLKGIEANFITYGICKSFDIIDNEDKIALLAGTLDFREDYYDLFLSVDTLNRMKNLDLFFRKINHTLKDKGVIVALEYIGPVNFQWSNKDIEIADMIYRSLNNKAGTSDSANLSLSALSNLSAGNTAGAVSSNDVIPMLESFFDILTIRYFGGPLYSLIFDKIPDRFDPNDKKDSVLIKTIIQFEQILIKQGVLENAYALIIARKRSSE